MIFFCEIASLHIFIFFEKKTIGQVTGTYNLHNCLKKINDIINMYQIEENKIGIGSENEDFWEIYYDHIDSTYSWVVGKILAKLHMMIYTKVILLKIC